MKNTTEWVTTPRSVSPSAVKKSVNASNAKWVRMKAGHVVVRLRSGAGGRPWRCRTFASITVPEDGPVHFIDVVRGWAEGGPLMDWARVLAYVTGTVDQELLARNEYLAA